ncbi:heme-binding protein [Mycobacterium sp. E740]|uniref:heme-binding protein n=1 Tax=Mycobacterium sp. E740 TaxID=1834149 RepID=UPI000801F0A6|nr:heme-binding protein [Mycobacterium sp. E740]OBI84809.1 hypothetical protein A5663_10520 [Mycobacterium sp. E740]
MNVSRAAVLAGAVTVGVVGALCAAPTAGAAPCTASGLATTASGVLAQAGGYLEAHPGANDVLTAAASQPPEQAKGAVRAYFMAHPNEYLDLQRIVGPLTGMRDQCGIAVSPGQFATLFDAMGG